MTQTSTTHTAIGVPRSGRYNSLFERRLNTGYLYIDALSHHAATNDIERVYNEIHRLDAALDRFQRYRRDQLLIVMMVEDARWHVPGEPPAGPICNLCCGLDPGVLLRAALTTAGAA